MRWDVRPSSEGVRLRLEGEGAEVEHEASHDSAALSGMLSAADALELGLELVRSAAKSCRLVDLEPIRRETRRG
jgi:hypothetical protein